MPFIRLDKFGSLGLVQDTVGQALNIGAFTDGLNMRFTGVEMQKMLEPTQLIAWTVEGATPQWMQFWADGLSSYVAVVATAGDGDYLYFWHDNGLGIGTWDVAGGPYSSDGNWQSFAYGDTVIFNNGVDVPQIFNASSATFEDLPNWGLISTADDILNNREPSKLVQASCTSLQPYKTFLVASGVTESGLYQPNKVWWSDSSNEVGYYGAPNWDYETPASLSGQIEIDPESGAIRTSAQLNENLIIYTDTSATAMTFVGGSFVMSFRRLFNKGAAGLHCVAEFNNQHFAVSQDQIYIHDGSTVNLIAKDRIEEEFFIRAGKGGRFGGGEVDWEDCQVVKNPDRKEILVNFGEKTAAVPPVVCKEYECDAYQEAILATGALYLLMTTEANGESLVDASGNGRNYTNKTATQGPYLSDAGLTPCDEDNYIDANDTNAFWVRTTAPGQANDPEWYNTLDDITYHTVMEYQNDAVGTLTLIETYTADSDSPNESPTQSIGISRLAGGDVRIGFSNFYFGVGGYYSQFLAPLTQLQKPVGQPFPFGIHLKRNTGATSPWETYVEIYVDHQLVQSATLTTMASPYSVNERAKLAAFGTGFSTSGAVWNGIDVHLAQNWAKAGSLSTEELAALADAWAQNQIGYQDPRPECTPCLVYECDAYDQFIRDSLPASYWPMTGGLAETDAVSNPIGLGVTLTDQMGNTTGMLSEGSGGTINVEGTAIHPDRCVGEQTAFEHLGAGVNRFKTSTHGVPSTGNGTITADFNASAAAGEPIDISWRIANATAIGQIEINGGITANTFVVTIQTRCCTDGGDQIFNCGEEIASGELAYTGTKVQPQVVWTYDSGANITTWTVYKDWDFDTVLFTTTQEGAINKLGMVPHNLLLLSQGAISWQQQYTAVWDRAIESTEADEFAAAMAQNLVGYQDPRPECTPCLEYACDAYSDALLALSPVAYYPMNIAADLAGYPSSIKDYSGNANDLPWTSVGTDLNAVTDASDIDNCSGEVTEYSNGASTILRRDIEGINQYTATNDWTYLANVQGQLSAGVLFNLVIKELGGANNETGFNGSWDSNNIIWRIDRYGYSPSNFTVDYDTIDPDWPNKVIGCRVSANGAGNTLVEALLDFVVVDSTTMTGEFLSPSFSSNIYEMMQMSGQRWQEQTLYNRKLSDAELLTLSEAWDQNKIGYQDPRPECQ